MNNTRDTDLRYAAWTVTLLFLAHALAFFLHEYSHSFIAWLVGYKDNPLAINYGHLDLANLLLQQEIDEKVDYDPIFAAGQGYLAALIALAGPFLGNGLLYVVCHRVLKFKAGTMGPGKATFVFWLAVMAAANVWSYAPVRTLTDHADIATATRGLGLNSWQMLPLVTLPSIAILWACFGHLIPHFLDTSGLSSVRRVFVIAISCTICFAVFGAVAIGGNYGNAAAVCSILSIFVVLPLVLMAMLTKDADSSVTGS